MPIRHSRSIRRVRHVRHRGPVSGAALPHERLKVGMQVVGPDGTPVGVIVAIRAADFRVRRPDQSDAWVPFDALAAIDRHRAVLQSTAA